MCLFYVVATETLVLSDTWAWYSGKWLLAEEGKTLSNLVKMSCYMFCTETLTATWPHGAAIHTKTYKC